MGSWKPFLDLKPHLWQAISERGHKELSFEEKCFKWDSLHIVAMSWWAVNSAKIELPEPDFREIADTLERQMADWNRGGIAGFSDLDKFIQGYEQQYRKMVEPREVIDFTKLLVGIWLLWNLTNKAKFNDEVALANMLGNLVYECVAGYWNVQK